MRDWLKRLICALVMIPLTMGWVMILVVYEPSLPLWLKMAATLLLCLLIVFVSWLCSEPVSFLRSMLLLAALFTVLFSTLDSSLDTVVYMADAALIFYCLGLILLSNHPKRLFNKKKWEVVFMVINLILESALVVLTGMIALKKNNSPLLAMTVSFGALSVCIMEICYKAGNDPEGYNYLKRHSLVGLSHHNDLSTNTQIFQAQFVWLCNLSLAVFSTTITVKITRASFGIFTQILLFLVFLCIFLENFCWIPKQLDIRKNLDDV